MCVKSSITTESLQQQRWIIPSSRGQHGSTFDCCRHRHIKGIQVITIYAAYCLRGELDGLHGGFMMNGVIMLLSSTPKNWFRLLGKKLQCSEY